MNTLTRLIAPALTCFALAATGSPALAQSADAATGGCAHEATATLGFTDGASADTATVTIVGPHCAGAVIVLVVRDPNGAPIYEDVWPLFWFADNTGALPSAASVAERVRPRIDGDMADQRAAADMENDFQWLEVPGAYFDALRAQGGAILCYETGHESGSCAAFDAEQNHGVRVLSSGH